MPRVIEALRSFDRKERFAVLRETLGFDLEAPHLDYGFRAKLNNCIDKKKEIQCPQQAFLAMDYHLDWIEMALDRAARRETGPKSPFLNKNFSEINKNQQDVDLLIAFEADVTGNTTTHLVLIEAKAYLYWNNAQLIEKANRLRVIFGEDGERWKFVRPHYVLMTAKRSQGIRPHAWPKWMRDGDEVNWLDYDLPSRLKISRCTENGKLSKAGGFLAIK